MVGSSLFFGDIMKKKSIFGNPNCVVSLGCSTTIVGQRCDTIVLDDPHPWPKKKEEENSMTTQNTERDYLKRRLMDALYIFQDDIATAFRIRNSETPKTYSELIDAIKNGKYTLDEKVTKRVDAYFEENGFTPWGPFYGIKFQLDTAPDRDGYDAAEKALNKRWQDAQDIIMTGDAAAGLKALQDFEAWKPAGPAN